MKLTLLSLLVAFAALATLRAEGTSDTTTGTDTKKETQAPESRLKEGDTTTTTSEEKKEQQ